MSASTRVEAFLAPLLPHIHDLIELAILGAILSFVFKLVLTAGRDGEGLFERKRLRDLMSRMAAMTVLFVVGASVTSEDGLFGSEAAAWAQGGGTILALLIAVYVGQMTHEVEERRRQAAKRDQLAMITDAVGLALDNFEPVRRAVQRRNNVDLQDAFAQLSEARQKPLKDLAAMPLPSWPSAILYSRVLALEDMLRSYRNHMDHVRPTVHVDENRWNGGTEFDGRMARAIREYEQSIAGVKLD